MALLGRAAQRAAVAAAGTLALAAAACGDEAADARRLDRCVDRLSSNAENESSDARQYVRKNYCEPFENNGWLYDDGALRVAVVRAYAAAEQCATLEADGDEPRTVPCPPPATIDCALLRHVRRGELRQYLRELGDDVRCDDETPLDELGVP